MRVAVLAAEAVPYSKTGGLGDVAGALPKALRQVGVDSILITPLYRQTKETLLEHLAFDDLPVDWRGRDYHTQIYYSEANGSPTFLIHAPEMFFRDSIYGYREDYERFAFFNHAAIVLLRRVGKPIDIVHLNDWHCGFAAIEIAKLRRCGDEFWRNTRIGKDARSAKLDDRFSSRKRGGDFAGDDRGGNIGVLPNGDDLLGYGGNAG